MNEKKTEFKRLTESEVRMIEIIRAYRIEPEIILKEISYLADVSRLSKAVKKEGDRK